MQPISPVLPGSTVQSLEIVLGEGQKEFAPLPALCQTLALRDGVLSGPFVQDIRQANYVVTRWELTDEDIERLKESRSIYVSTWKPIGEAFNAMTLDTEPPIQPTDITITPVERLIDERERAMPIQDTDSESN